MFRSFSGIRYCRGAARFFGAPFPQYSNCKAAPSHSHTRRHVCVAAQDAGAKKRRPYFSPENMVTQEGTRQGPVPGAPQHGTTQGRLVLVDTLALMYRIHFGYGSKARLTTRHGDETVDTTIVYGMLDVIIRLMEIQPAPTHFAMVVDMAAKTWSGGEEEGPAGSGRERDSRRDFRAHDPFAARPARPRLRPMQQDLLEGRTSTLGPPSLLSNDRHELYPSYKAQRPAPPEEFHDAGETLERVFKLMGLPMLGIPGVEADDLIGTFGTRFLKAGGFCVVVSNDKDFFQLLQPGLQMLRPPSKERSEKTVAGLAPFTAADFEALHGLRPDQWTDYLALVGDASDNLPGVKGIGEKGAKELLQKFGNMDNLLASTDDIKKKSHREMLQSDLGRDAALMGKKLVSIQTDLDLPSARIDIDEMLLRAPPGQQQQKLTELFDSLEFTQHGSRLMKVWSRL